MSCVVALRPTFPLATQRPANRSSNESCTGGVGACARAGTKAKARTEAEIRHMDTCLSMPGRKNERDQDHDEDPDHQDRHALPGDRALPGHLPGLAVHEEAVGLVAEAIG